MLDVKLNSSQTKAPPARARLVSTLNFLPSSSFLCSRLEGMCYNSLQLKSEHLYLHITDGLEDCVHGFQCNLHVWCRSRMWKFLKFFQRHWLTSFVTVCVPKICWSKWTVKRPQTALIMIDWSLRYSVPQVGLSLCSLHVAIGRVRPTIMSPSHIHIYKGRSTLFHFNEKFWFKNEKEDPCWNKKQGSDVSPGECH